MLFRSANFLGKNERGLIQVLSRQLFGNSKYLEEAMTFLRKHVPISQERSLQIDLNPMNSKLPENFRVRSFIFNKNYQIVFVPSKKR